LPTRAGSISDDLEDDVRPGTEHVEVLAGFVDLQVTETGIITSPAVEHAADRREHAGLVEIVLHAEHASVAAAHDDILMFVTVPAGQCRRSGGDRQYDSK
jgi:hypothetical protein